MESYPIIDRSNVAKDWHARGFSCGVWIDHAGREWKTPTHETDELFMPMSGELELEIGGERFQPSVGEEIHIPGGMSYTIRNIGGTTARWLYGQKRKPSAALQPLESMGDLIHSPL
jgi:mannose-6-phosphate isomerase-like protein (cupin superfamily)